MTVFKKEILIRFIGTVGCDLIRDHPTKTDTIVQKGYTDRVVARVLKTFGM
jgi:hypothetical protein